MVNNRNKKKKPLVSTDSEIEEQINNDFTDEQQKLYEIFERRLEKTVDGLVQKLTAKDEMIDTLRAELGSLRRKVIDLENKVEDTEAYERRDTIVVSGSDLPLVTEGEDSSEIFTDLVKNKIGVTIVKTNISVAHRLGPKPTTQTPDKRNLIVKFCRREDKHDVMKAWKTVRPRNLFVNESLTRNRSTLMYGLRQAKKRFPDKVAGCGSFDGKVYVWLKPPNPDSPRARNTKTMVNTRDKFSELCENYFKCSATDLVSSWSKTE